MAQRALSFKRNIPEMARRSVMAQQKKRAAPRTDKGTLIALRLEPGPLARVDRWAASQKDDPSRPEALQRLVELGLASTERAGARTKTAAKASDNSESGNRPLG